MTPLFWLYEIPLMGFSLLLTACHGVTGHQVITHPFCCNKHLKGSSNIFTVSHKIVTLIMLTLCLDIPASLHTISINTHIRKKQEN